MLSDQAAAAARSAFAALQKHIPGVLPSNLTQRLAEGFQKLIDEKSCPMHSGLIVQICMCERCQEKRVNAMRAACESSHEIDPAMIRRVYDPRLADPHSN